MPATFKANCSATAIGSFPHPDPGAAFKLIPKTLPEVPCWPQLPKRVAKSTRVRRDVLHHCNL
ncbi:MAG TPA: hypothetical protein ACFYD2_06540 [Candidatus Avalokitesvara rifleensis]|uniref:hypothetical protein n=1 Tax=Candidatus Avalokitesvara rifleensis TaxID=3367620 RepID=UPI00271438BC|nr:hypothetical protein [Candidatus Brocadiales bacterium]